MAYLLIVASMVLWQHAVEILFLIQLIHSVSVQFTFLVGSVMVCVALAIFPGLPARLKSRGSKISKNRGITPQIASTNFVIARSAVENPGGQKLAKMNASPPRLLQVVSSLQEAKLKSRGFKIRKIKASPARLPRVVSSLQEARLKSRG